jgi:hypothetical protein
MRIGIFGDSFASDNKMNPTDSWVDILRNNHEVENHAMPGTNLYFSVLKLKENYKKYEKIIFVVTQPSRIKISDNVPCYDPSKRHIGHAPTIGRLIKAANEHEIYDGPLIDAYNAALNYYKYIQDTTYDEYIHTLMLDDILKICPNIILIPAFTDSIPNSQISSLIEIRTNENKAWGFEYFIPPGFIDERNCHLTAENNSILAEKAEEWLRGKTVDTNINDFATPTNKEFYIRKL